MGLIFVPGLSNQSQDLGAAPALGILHLESVAASQNALRFKTFIFND